jgi:hypothetical protein
MNLERNDQDDADADADVVRRLAGLPRTTPIDPDRADRLVAQLRREGFLRPRRPVMSWSARAAAAILLFTLGAFAGTRYARGNSLDAMLSRPDLGARASFCCNTPAQTTSGAGSRQPRSAGRFGGRRSRPRSPARRRRHRLTRSRPTCRHDLPACSHPQLP